MSEAVISTPDVHSGLSSTELIDMALARGEGVLSDTGALRVETGARTGRSDAMRGRHVAHSRHHLVSFVVG